ncbi:MAG TPA: TetR/AcrR family transcriptional regulator C-terminal domain-containing protein [Actinomycetota bacterium]|nr:TetR/AcrR family transcriptional regulator C-terminal domain-containing protein [Actinomycetota bacterium]
MPEKLEHLENESVEPTQGDGETSTLRRREPLTRERILRAALRVMDEEGLEAVTMRRLGRELGVEAMSLYNHVEDKEAILDGILEVVMAEFQFPEETGDWEADVRAGARAWRRLMIDHPTVIALFAESKHPASSPERLRPMEWAFDLLGRGGLSEDEVVHAFRAFGGYIMGSVLNEVANPVPGMGDRDHHAEHVQLAGELPPTEFPNLVRLLPLMAECDAEVDFEFGLDLLISGLRAKVEASGA